jgi:hypothetical protein
MNTNPAVTLTIALLSLITAVSAVAQQNIDELKQRVLAQAQSLSPDDYAFTRTVRSETTLGRKTQKKVVVEKFDPTQPADARWTLVSIDGAPPSTAALKRYRKEATKRRMVPGYHRLANYFGTPAKASNEPGAKAVFRFASLPKGAVSILNNDFSRRASAEVLVSEANGEPLAEQVRFTVKPPRRMQLLFKVNPFETIARYRIGPEGKPFLVESTSEMTGTLLGLRGAMRNTMIYSDYQAVRISPQS